MSLSLVGEGDAAAASANLPAVNNDDICYVLAFNNASTTIPSLPAGWTSVTTRTGTSCAMRVGIRQLLSTDTTTGTWTNATHVIFVVLRGVDLGHLADTFVANGASSATPTWSALTLKDPNGRSWVVLLGGHRTATDMNSVALGSTTNENPTQTSLAAHTARGVGSWASTSKTVNANSAWLTVAIEAPDAGLHDRVSQAPVEAVEGPTDAKARVSQAPVEAVQKPTSGKARISQAPIEIVGVRTTPAVVSQAPVEVVIQNTLKARISQAEIEAGVIPTDAKERVSQIEIEAAVAATDARERVSQITLEVLVQSPVGGAKVYGVIIG